MLNNYFFKKTFLVKEFKMLYLFPLHNTSKFFLNILYKISMFLVFLVLVVGKEVIKSYGAAFRSKEITDLLLHKVLFGLSFKHTE